MADRSCRVAALRRRCADRHRNAPALRCGGWGRGHQPARIGKRVGRRERFAGVDSHVRRCRAGVVGVAPTARRDGTRLRRGAGGTHPRSRRSGHRNRAGDHRGTRSHGRRSRRRTRRLRGKPRFAPGLCLAPDGQSGAGGGDRLSSVCAAPASGAGKARESARRMAVGGRSSASGGRGGPCRPDGRGPGGDTRARGTGA